ncbi:MAG: glycosyltransferase family protein [Desulfovibrionales bacterium]
MCNLTKQTLFSASVLMTSSITRKSPRILMLSFGYYLERELSSAAKRLDIPFLLFKANGRGKRYVPDLLQAVRDFKPSFLLSVNMLGLDDSGNLPEILSRFQIPIGIWFIDSPEHFLPPQVKTPQNLAVFTTEPQAVSLLQNKGYAPVECLPLAADASRFDLGSELFLPEPRLGVTHVGTTWIEKKALCLKNTRFPRFILRRFKNLAREFARTPSSSVREFLARADPQFLDKSKKALDPRNLRDLFILICWEANHLFRTRMIEKILPFRPLIVGDRYWGAALRGREENFVYHPPIGYYLPDLPALYRMSRVNFATSSVQMPTSVTQRAFDVPAAGGFLLSDMRDQLIACFEPEKEIWTYSSADEIPEKVARGLRDRASAAAVVHAARKRIMAEHTYEHRLKTIIRTMRRSFPL